MSLQNQKIAINIAIAFTADWMNGILETDPKTLAFISEKIQKAIQAVGAEGGFTFIYDLSIPAVIYTGNGAVDATPLVKAKLGIQ